MKKSRFTESQIIAILEQHENGLKVGDICREKGISQATFYNWESGWNRCKN
jgi:putative transposase